MNKSRTAGVLLHISSLPSPYACGVMGRQAREFVDMLSQMSFRVWQVLPLMPVDDAGSPYCSVSAFAGNVALIDPDALVESGLLREQEVKGALCPKAKFSADFEYAKTAVTDLLEKAFLRIDDEQRETLSLFRQQNDWVEDYALFMAAKELHAGDPWWKWGDDWKIYENALKNRHKVETRVDFYIFSQFIFYSQWRSLKQYANSRGIIVFGDMPIYVSRDSADVWSNASLFSLERESLSPRRVAGVPPDYFSSDGQLWGNPLYDWSSMEKDGYSWWIKRLRFAFKQFDKVRIDHFRAFASYWSVPAESKTAAGGRWESGPGMKLFSAVSAQLGELDVVAEDLGCFGSDVVRLLEETGFPGMRVVQFGFDENADSTHLPHNYPHNCVAYVGTHDNNTLLGWLWEAGERERAFALDYCGFSGGDWGEGGARSPSCRAITECVWRSSADTAVIAVQDMLGYGADTRMNTPGTSSGNWRFRLSREGLCGIDMEYFSRINSIFKRTYLPWQLRKDEAK